MKRVPYADHIICLGDKGKVVEQGSFADLRNAGGYVASFSLPAADWSYDPNSDGGDDDDVVVVDSDQNSEDVIVAQKNGGDMIVARQKDQGSGSSSFTGSNDTTHDQDTESKSNRQTGDLQIYLYYVRAVGWWPSLVFIAAITGFVFCISFPSE